MLPLTLSVCSQCRHALVGTKSESWRTLASLSFRRHRTGSASAKSKRSPGSWDNIVKNSDKGARDIPRQFSGNGLGDPSSSSRPPPFRSGVSKKKDWHSQPRPTFQLWEHTGSARDPVASPTKSSPRVDPTNIPAIFETGVESWSRHRGLQRRLESFGIPANEVKPLLSAFVRAVQSGSLSTPEGHELYALSRFIQESADGNAGPPSPTNADIIYSTILFTWASQPAHAAPLHDSGLLPTTVERIQTLARAADRSYPAEEFPGARKLHRKVIMHVGPTNSGKTHNALRALAAAGSGVYAGPLRLLAHEIWERLNLGQIVPLGMDQDAEVEVPVSSTEGVDSSLDIGEKAPAVRKLGNPKHARLCNMVTGEEQKIVAEGAPLLSCTVEMLGFRKMYDVAVVDEIQMIADEARGSGWTRAVLGLSAKELHLCGEETAVPVIRELLKDTGDELIVNRYERLSPLQVEEESLEGDFSRVRKGDCIVTFSRNNIFAIKRRIESMSSMRCAVVYGMLPPEIRSEQAALFNDPDSGYDILIGSDAIGMGLNLKIRRVIFEAVRKFDGTSERYLSVSQTKQIAGRAGRYGLQAAGFTTALFPADVDFIRRTLDIPVAPLKFARLGHTKESFNAFAFAMPPDCSMQAVFDAHLYISKLPPILRYTEEITERQRQTCELVDRVGAKLPLADRLMVAQAPIAWRDPACMVLVTRFLEMFGEEMEVDLSAALECTDLLENLERIEERMRGQGKGRPSSEMLLALESFHKALVVYVWMSFRQPVVWSCHEEVTVLKGRVERALEWTLQALTKNQPAGKSWKEHLTAQRERSRRIPHTTRRELLEQKEHAQVKVMGA
ncbi:ATP-dependent RNA helicase suv3 [Lyophyllum atratum]|nr:ATP-dependent RNA helicase suv3 [Lyophyllum atratum]